MTPANFDQEQNFAACYEKLRDVIKLDYSVALSIFKCMHEFLAEGLESTVEIDSAVNLPENAVRSAGQSKRPDVWGTKRTEIRK